jgi:hypothetical protein
MFNGGDESPANEELNNNLTAPLLTGEVFLFLLLTTLTAVSYKSSPGSFPTHTSPPDHPNPYPLSSSSLHPCSPNPLEKTFTKLVLIPLHR